MGKSVDRGVETCGTDDWGKEDCCTKGGRGDLGIEDCGRKDGVIEDCSIKDSDGSCENEDCGIVDCGIVDCCTKEERGDSGIVDCGIKGADIEVCGIEDCGKIGGGKADVVALASETAEVAWATEGPVMTVSKPGASNALGKCGVEVRR